MPNADRILKAYDAGKLKALQDFVEGVRVAIKNRRDTTRDDIVSLAYDQIRELSKKGD